MPLDSTRVLLVSSDGSIAEAAGAPGVRAATGAAALAVLAARPVDVVLLDLDVADIAPRDLVATIAQRFPGLPVVLVAASERVGEAVDLVRNGAEDYVRKPVHPKELAFTLEKAVTALGGDDVPPPSRAFGAGAFVGSSAAMLGVLRLVERAAKSHATVLVRGETGSGKELVARRVHELSPRAARPFMKVHCAALPEPLLESELFGYEKGAFTGAQARKPGRVELAEGGTLFLDEIGDITPSTQVKLLRILQDRKYERLGGAETIDADVRFVTATHRNLEEMVARGEFREDLYYRINVVSVTVPPLREHPGDVPDLARHFAAIASRENGRASVELSDGAVKLLQGHRWPGNVRQLQNVVERLVVMTDAAVVGEEDVLEELRRIDGSPAPAELPADPSMSLEASVVLLNDAVRKAERRALEKALRRAGGNRTTAARILGISRRTLYYKLEEHGLGG